MIKGEGLRQRTASEAQTTVWRSPEGKGVEGGSGERQGCFVGVSEGLCADGVSQSRAREACTIY